MSDLPMRLRNIRRSGKPIDTCLEAADYIENLAMNVYEDKDGQRWVAQSDYAALEVLWKELVEKGWNIDAEQQRTDECKVRIAALEARCRDYATAESDRTARLLAARERIAELEVALRKYGLHLYPCPAQQWQGNEVCDCGFRYALTTDATDLPVETEVDAFDSYPVGTLFQKEPDGRLLAMLPNGETKLDICPSCGENTGEHLSGCHLFIPSKLEAAFSKEPEKSIIDAALRKIGDL